MRERLPDRPLFANDASAEKFNPNGPFCAAIRRLIIAAKSLRGPHPRLTTILVASDGVKRYQPDMTAVLRHFCLVTAAAGAITIVVATQLAQAEDASAWSNDSRSSIRLIAGSNANDAAPLHAGIEMKLLPGWHTYWRYPGDSGVPPRFDFSGSDNLRSAKVQFPAPQVHTDEAGSTIGYESSVVFPVAVTPKDPGKPVALKLKADYAVCDKLCVPAEGSAALTLAPGASKEDADLKAAEARVPKRVSDAKAGLTARRVTGGAKPLVMVDLRAPANAPVSLFVEGPTADWALPIPKPAQSAPAGHRHFSFELDGLPPGVDPNKGPFNLTFTVVEGQRAYEVTTRLD
jgi:DsbC/DsbD-like thiol-disulfide interchange protein